MVAQAIYVAKEEGKRVVIGADDTDIYVLLMYHYHAESLDAPMRLQPTPKARASIDIQASVSNLSNIIPELLPAHALSGCDTVSMCYRIGKGKMLKPVKSGRCSLRLLGDITVDVESVTEQAVAFMCSCLVTMRQMQVV